MKSRERLYWVLSLFSLAAYGWVVISLAGFINEDFTPCLFKQITGVACPSCGTTRSLLALLQGKFTEALLINPLGFAALVALIVIPVWLVIDLIYKNASLYSFYFSFEKAFNNKLVFIPAIVLIAVNWSWNIFKGL